MANPVCMSPLKFYDGIAKQNHRRAFAYGHITPVICDGNSIIPFQLVLPEEVSYSGAVLFDAKTDTNLGSITLPNISVVSSNEYYVLMCKGGQLGIPHEGLFYISITAGNYTYYSDVFSCSNSIGDYTKIEYWNQENDFYINNGVITFANDFHFIVYLKTNLGKPEYDYDEEATKRLGYSFIESLISKKTYKFNALVTEAICDAIRLVRLCSNKQITNYGELFNAITFNMDVDWQQNGDTASLTCEFQIDDNIVNLGGLNIQ